MTLRFTVRVAVAAIFVGGSSAGMASDPSRSEIQQRPAFRSRIDTVSVSVRVVDNATGEPVTGLTARDFTVTEGGVLQEVSVFAAPSVLAPEHRRRVFLIVLGHGRSDGPVRHFEGVIEFLRQRLRSGDMASVMAFNRLTPLSEDHESTARLVERLRSRNNDILFRIMQDAQRTRNTADISESTQAAIDDAFQLEGAPPQRLRSAASLLLGTSPVQMNERGWRPWNRLLVTRDLLKVYAGLEFLRGLEGEKQIVCLTLGLSSLPVTLVNAPTGLGLDSRDDDVQLEARANDVQVVLNIVHTSDPTRGGSRSAVMASRNVAEMTGGLFTSVKAADTALAHVDKATRHRYILGYVPADSSMNGAYRQISVRVNRRNVTVLFPHGYTARAETPPVDVRGLLTRERLRDAAATDVPLTDIKVRASVGAPWYPSQPTRVELLIDGSRLSLSRVGDRWTGMIDLLVLCGDSRQRVVGSLNQQMTISLDDAHYAKAMAGGLPYVAVVPVTGAPANVKVVVYDYDADLIGTANIRAK